MNFTCHSVIVTKYLKSLYSYAFAFYAATYLTGDKKKYFDAIEDVIAQADEVDEAFLQVKPIELYCILQIAPMITSLVCS